MIQPAAGQRARQPDLRLVVPAAGAWVTAATLCARSPRTAAAVALIAAAGVALGLGWRRPWCAAAALGVAAAAAATGVHVASLRAGPVASLAPEHATADVMLRLTRDPVEVGTRKGPRLVVVDATAIAVRRPSGQWHLDKAPVVVFGLDPSWLGLIPGQRVQATAKVAPPRHGDAVAAALLTHGPPHLIGRPPVWQRAAARVRSGLRRACIGLPDDERGLLPGVVIGDVALMPSTLTTAFRVTGLAHLNAVSGANVAIVLAAVGAASRGAGIGRRARIAVAAAALVGFVVLVRPSPSVLRAAVMGAVVLVGTATGRPRRAIPALAAAVLALVVLNPFLAPSPGFAMSVLATAAIVVLGPRWTERLAGWTPRPIAAAIAVPAAAQLACTPVIVSAFGQLTPYAIPANLLAAPAVAPATLLGVLCALLGVVSGSAAHVVAWLAAVPVAWLVVVARGFAALPLAGMTWAHGWHGLGLLVLSAGGAMLLGRAILATWR